jgi:hypothetical protein
MPEAVCGTANRRKFATIPSAIPDWTTAARVPS